MPDTAATSDPFQGDDGHLILSTQALLDLDAAGALTPHGIGGHARTLLTSYMIRLATRRPQAPA